MPYKVIVYDNAHYMDESESYTHGEFETYEAALSAAKKLVDDELGNAFKPGMPPEDLYRQFAAFGVDPVIVPPSEPPFSAWDYAKERSLELCAPPRDVVEPAPTPALSEWFRVSFDEAGITMEASAPGSAAWREHIEWARITIVCFKTGDFTESDEIYIFTDERPESYLIPTEASGGLDLWNEIIRRGLFDAEMAIEAAASPAGMLFQSHVKPGEG